MRSVEIQVVTWDPLHGSVGTPAAWAMREDPILSPRALIGPEGGPKKQMPRARREAGSSGTSEAWPQPGHTACTPVLSAICHPWTWKFHYKFRHYHFLLIKKSELVSNLPTASKTTLQRTMTWNMRLHKQYITVWCVYNTVTCFLITQQRTNKVEQYSPKAPWIKMWCFHKS